MTALKKFERVETTGLWRDTESSQRKNVFVSVGDNSLIITDTKGTALAHWSLPAVHRVNPADHPPIYAPSPDDDENIEIEDSTMIAVIEHIRGAIASKHRHRGRLRGVSLGLSLCIVVLLLSVWLPKAVKEHTLNVLPFEKRSEIGQLMVTEMSNISGGPCHAPETDATLHSLFERFLPKQNVQLTVLPDAVSPVMFLTGGHMVVSQRLFIDYDTPDVVERFIRSEYADNMEDVILSGFLDEIGFVATLQLLTTGRYNTGELRQYTQTLINKTVSSQLDDISENTQKRDTGTMGVSISQNRSNDKIKNSQSFSSLNDSAWIALQNVCEEQIR